MDPVTFWNYSLAEIDLMFDGHLRRTDPQAWKAAHRAQMGPDELKAEFEGLMHEMSLKSGGETA